MITYVLTRFAGALLLLETFCKENGSTENLKSIVLVNSLNNPLVIQSKIDEAEEPDKSQFSYLSVSESEEEGAALWSELNNFLKTSFATLPRWRQSINASPMLKSTLKNFLGSEQTLFECCGGGAKVGVTVLRAKDSTPCIFSNYNGDGRRPGNYSLIRPNKMKQEPLLWQV
jgi:hypothetical protein